MMTPAMRPNGDDASFKSMFSRPEHAATLLRSILPQQLTPRVDFASLALRPGSYLGEALDERSSDVLFSVKIAGRPALVYFLIAHKSSADGKTGLRLLRSVVRIWEAWERDEPHAAKLPLILPVVLLHGEDGWTGATAFGNLLDADEDTLAAAAPFFPCFRFLVEDVSHQTEARLRALAMLDAWAERGTSPASWT
jgi:hypothetical protein